MQKNKEREKYDIRKWKRPEIRKKYRVELRNRFQELMELKGVEEVSEALQKNVY